MSQDLKRRIEKLERAVGATDFQIKLRRLIRRSDWNEESVLRAVKGYERELGPTLGVDGTITWERYVLLYHLLAPSADASEIPMRTRGTDDSAVARFSPGTKYPRNAESKVRGAAQWHHRSTQLSLRSNSKGMQESDRRMG